MVKIERELLDRTTAQAPIYNNVSTCVTTCIVTMNVCVHPCVSLCLSPICLDDIPIQ